MKLDNLQNYKIILSSQSPRRSFLLKEAGVEFEVCVKNSGEEDFPQEMSCQDVAMFLAQKKAEPWIGNIADDQLIITADTVVILENQIINKPKDKQDAVRMLSELSGKMHHVITGVCLMTKQKSILFESKSEVYFRELSTDEIEFYVEKYQPFDKAGSYGIQEWIGYVGITKINGCFFNVMGLPIQKIWEELKKF